MKAWYNPTIPGPGGQGRQFPSTMHSDLSTGLEEAMPSPRAREKTSAEAYPNPTTPFNTFDESFWQDFTCEWDGILENMQV